MDFSSPCIGTPDGFGQGGAMSGSSGSSANVSSSSSSINLIPKVLFYSQTPLYGHPLNMNTLLYYGQFALSPGKGSPYIFSKFNRHNKDTPLIRTLSVPINGVWLYLSPKVQGRDGLSLSLSLTHTPEDDWERTREFWELSVCSSNSRSCCISSSSSGSNTVRRVEAGASVVMLLVLLAAVAAVAVVPSSNRSTLCSSAVGGRAATAAEATVV